MEWALVIEMRVRVKVGSKSEVLEEGADRPCVLTKLLHNPSHSTSPLPLPLISTPSPDASPTHQQLSW